MRGITAVSSELFTKEVVIKPIVAAIVVAALVATASALVFCTIWRPLRNASRSITTSIVFAKQRPATGRETLAQALKGAWLPLESGLIVSSTQGTPLSAKYEIDDGAFQLSVYTVKADANAGDAFMEVIVHYSAGMIAQDETIT